MQSSPWQVLWQEALEARKFAYAPYSNYAVGAALQACNGTIYHGCNIENAAYTPGNCAERTAIFKAVSEGVRDFSAIAVVTQDGGTPCGVCRQVLREFAPNITIITGNLQRILAVYDLPHLLPESFGPENLQE